MPYHVYMWASRRCGTLYPGFTATCAVMRLVWYETYERIDEAIAREKSLKKWRRDWKVRLIEEMNPDWSDLYASLNMGRSPSFRGSPQG